MTPNGAQKAKGSRFQLCLSALLLHMIGLGVKHIAHLGTIGIFATIQMQIEKLRIGICKHLYGLFCITSISKIFEWDQNLIKYVVIGCYEPFIYFLSLLKYLAFPAFGFWDRFSLIKNTL